MGSSFSVDVNSQLGIALDRLRDAKSLMSGERLAQGVDLMKKIKNEMKD